MAALRSVRWAAAVQDLSTLAKVLASAHGLVGWFLVAPHASAKVLANHAAGAYSVTATPGLGYSYRWDGLVPATATPAAATSAATRSTTSRCRRWRSA